MIPDPRRCGIGGGSVQVVKREVGPFVFLSTPVDTLGLLTLCPTPPRWTPSGQRNRDWHTSDEDPWGDGPVLLRSSHAGVGTLQSRGTGFGRTTGPLR